MFLQEYEKLRLLGKGAFASVYKVRHAELDYVRALKVSHELIESKDDKVWKTFLEECKMLLRIGNGAHPNIVRIYQPKLLENKAAVEMDFVDGLSLAEYIGTEKFISIDEFKAFAMQIVGALAYCHVDIYRFLMDAEKDNLEPDPNDGRRFIISPKKEQELIAEYSVTHNDLHSNNIIRRHYDGQYILLDFGLSIQNDHCVKSSSRGDGAIEYTAPEKLENNLTSKQSDVYALGILLYEMLTGRVPFQCKGNSPESARAKVYMQHLNETPPNLINLRKLAFESTHPGMTFTDDLPDGLVDIVMTCLAKNPEERFENAKVLLTALQECFAHHSEPEQPQQPQPEQPQPEQPQYAQLDPTVIAELQSEIKQLRADINSMHQNLAQKITRRNVTEAPGTITPPPTPPVPASKEKTWIKVFTNFLWLLVLVCSCFMCLEGLDHGFDWYERSDYAGYFAHFGAWPFIFTVLCVIIPWLVKPKWKFINVLFILCWTVFAVICSLFDHYGEDEMLMATCIGAFTLIIIHKLQYRKAKQI